jgi:site-specific recombinase XerC
LLALGFAGALRRSELVGLDWKEQGSGDGVVSRDERGIVLTLLRTKGGKGEPETVIVPCQDMPTACEALERWAKTANLQPGEPVFRAIDKGQHISAGRLTDRSVARIIKARVRARALGLVHK